ncbi:MAG: DsbA family protein [Sneathiella sp.]|nr:DsbA family protein [Sneathiella sp.]
MKRYNETTSSMQGKELPISRRHFVSSSALAPFALGAAGSLLAGTAAAADVMEILEDDMVLGDRTAPLAIVEYASLTCGHCANFHNNTLPKLEEDFINTGKAYIVYRDYPLDRFAFQASVLAHTAGEKLFFPVLKLLFKEQAAWTSASDITEALTAIARKVGISQAKFEEALKDETLGERILMDRMVGSNEYGVSGTPTLFINGELYQGDWANYEAFSSDLQDMISA